MFERLMSHAQMHQQDGKIFKNITNKQRIYCKYEFIIPIKFSLRSVTSINFYDGQYLLKHMIHLSSESTLQGLVTTHNEVLLQFNSSSLLTQDCVYQQISLGRKLSYCSRFYNGSHTRDSGIITDPDSYKHIFEFRSKLKKFNITQCI